MKLHVCTLVLSALPTRSDDTTNLQAKPETTNLQTKPETTNLQAKPDVSSSPKLASETSFAHCIKDQNTNRVRQRGLQFL